MAPRWHQGTIAPNGLSKTIKKEFGRKCSKANLSFECVLKVLAGMEYAGSIGNGYSFAYAKYGANPKKNTYSVTKLFLGNWGETSFEALGDESPHGGAILVFDATGASSGQGSHRDLAIPSLSLYSRITAQTRASTTIVSKPNIIV